MMTAGKAFTSPHQIVKLGAVKESGAVLLLSVLCLHFVAVNMVFGQWFQGVAVLNFKLYKIQSRME